MSVFTAVERAELDAFLAGYDLGRLTAYSGIEAGVENTNYHVDTDARRMVLTLFEEIGAAEIPFFLDLMSHLAAAGVRCPRPLPARDGRSLQPLCGRPAVLFERLPGSTLRAVAEQHCTAVGGELARLHLAGLSFAGHRQDPRGRHWREALAGRLRPLLNRADAELLDDEMQAQAALHDMQLPAGIIHADLFRDNVLFCGTRLAGFIDFYFACDGWLAYDLAVTLHDWCVDRGGRPVAGLHDALLRGYQSVRPLGAAETDALPLLLRAAALRFWLSRLQDSLVPRRRHGSLVEIKDPDEPRRILLARRALSGG